MVNSARSNSDFPTPEKHASDIPLQGAQISAEQGADNDSWDTIRFPGTIAIDHIPGPTPYLRHNAMESSSQSPSPLSSETSAEQSNQREAELLSLVRDLNECNDVLLAKVSQLEESLERSQAALQAEIDRSGEPSDRDIVQLVTELEQSTQSLQHQQRVNETFQTELITLRDRNHQLETEHASLVQQTTEQSQALLEANASCRDLRARLQRQQRYTLQFKAALEKCLTITPQGTHTHEAPPSSQGIPLPKTEEIRPWESTLINQTLDPQLESMIRGIHPNHQPSSPMSSSATEAEDQLWHDLARVMEPGEETDTPTNAALDLDSDVDNTRLGSANIPEPTSDAAAGFTEPSPWTQPITAKVAETSLEEQAVHPVVEEALPIASPLSPEAAEILARVQSANITTAKNTYLPVVAAQGSPSPVVNPLKPQKRIGSLAAIDLPNFPRLKKQSPAAKP